MKPAVIITKNTEEAIALNQFFKTEYNRQNWNDPNGSFNQTWYWDGKKISGSGTINDFSHYETWSYSTNTYGCLQDYKAGIYIGSLWKIGAEPLKYIWYICKVEGIRMPLKYNTKKFWCGLDGACYKPSQVMWLDDTEIG